MQEEIIIIGAGPAGLMAACELAKQHQIVLILEARDRIGGRAHTIYNDWGKVEAGAEFVHGDLPLTQSLLQDAGAGYTATSGTWVQVKSGTATEATDGKHWPQFMRKLKSLKKDMPLRDFLEQYFPEDKYAPLKDRAISYAEGYDSADATRVSCKALYEEWSKEEEEEYRIDEGYTSLIKYLAEQCSAAGSRTLLSHPVTAISFDGTGVAITAAGKLFSARKVIVALPLGVLQKEDAILLPDAATAHMQAIRQLGVGDVIKVVIRFTIAFWEDQYPDLGFLLSSASIPTWWTQAPSSEPVLTGWLAGRLARTHMHSPEAEIREEAIKSLAQIFSKSIEEVEALVVTMHVINWSADPFAFGSYAYTTVGAAAALRTLSAPAEGRLFFAGEYMYSGTAMGTVEAALSSGKAIAKQITGKSIK